MNHDTAITRISTWADVHEEFTLRQRELAIDAIIDTVACMVAGRNDASVLAVSSLFRDESCADSASAVDGRQHSSSSAALINGTAAHALDYDDNFPPAASHASAVLVPAILASAQSRKLSGASVVNAYLTGLQCQALIGEPVAAAHYTAGWHATSTIGMLGTSAAVASLLGADRETIANTMSIAVSLASGSKIQFGTPMKPIHAGLAARNAIDAALLACAGAHGRLDALEGPQGFQQLYGAAESRRWPDLESILARKDHAIETPGLWPKAHPCCGSTHLAIDAMLDLQREYQFSAEDIATVNITVLSANAQNLPYHRPRNVMEARFSMPYCLDRAVSNGHLSLSDFTPDAIRRHGSSDRLDRFTMTTWPNAQEQEFISSGRMPHKIELTLRNGRRLQAKRESSRGTLAEPFSRNERRRKFIDCTNDSRSSRMYDRLLAVEDEPDVDFVGKFLHRTAESNSATESTHRGGRL